MKINITFTDEYLDEEVNKVLCYTKCDQLFLSNMIDIKYVDFFKEIMPKFSEIVYFEHDRPICPVCGREMDDNGSREVKANKLRGIRKEQYICPECSKIKVTSLEPFIKQYCNYSYDIGEKCLNYDYIGYLS